MTDRAARARGTGVLPVVPGVELPEPRRRRDRAAPAPTPADARQTASAGLPTVPVDLGVIQPRRRLGVSDLRVFPLALGGNVFGWTADQAATTSVLDAYHDLGGNFVDTADSYAGGRS